VNNITDNPYYEPAWRAIMNLYDIKPSEAKAFVESRNQTKLTEQGELLEVMGEALEDCMDFPMRVDEVTIPTAYKLQFAQGDWTNLPQSVSNQIVFNASVGLTRVLKAKET